MSGRAQPNQRKADLALELWNPSIMLMPAVLRAGHRPSAVRVAWGLGLVACGLWPDIHAASRREGKSSGMCCRAVE